MLPPRVTEGIPIDLGSSTRLWDNTDMIKKLTSAEKLSERRDKEKQYNAGQFALALTRSLSQSVFRGKCKCGLMLTERDKAKGSDRHSCPRCGWTGELLAAAVA